LSSLSELSSSSLPFMSVTVRLLSTGGCHVAFFSCFYTEIYISNAKFISWTSLHCVFGSHCWPYDTFQSIGQARSHLLHKFPNLCLLGQYICSPLGILLIFLMVEGTNSTLSYLQVLET
jgi:hypothetical protein